MPHFTYTLKLHTHLFDDETADKIYKAGCGDALYHSDVNGVYLTFDRESESLEQAVLTARQQLFSVGINTDIEECNNEIL